MDFPEASLQGCQSTYRSYTPLGQTQKPCGCSYPSPQNGYLPLLKWLGNRGSKGTGHQGYVLPPSHRNQLPLDPQIPELCPPIQSGGSEWRFFSPQSFVAFPIRHIQFSQGQVQCVDSPGGSPCFRLLVRPLEKKTIGPVVKSIPFKTKWKKKRKSKLFVYHQNGLPNKYKVHELRK